ncbi:DUF4838 domain-containing protein [Paenibacillus contaminans]|uniref:FIMAH domain-containing protein n=1 Tax=Paenibacillus contaminans TaxID=450362 RepID=A0A329MRK2_9BACL|nr:DUF4838 domain-containing protein [Paenibacillus contaminans]RAV22565.1 hypothetical protein DQG23_06425 [Paenibacillus contaminans]
MKPIASVKKLFLMLLMLTIMLLSFGSAFNSNAVAHGEEGADIRSSTTASNGTDTQGYTATYDEPGTYGPSKGVDIVRNDVVVSVSGVTLHDIKIFGNLLLTDGIREGEVFLENVDVKGTMTVSSKDLTLHLDKKSKIDTLAIQELTHVTGQGKIDEAIVHEGAKGSTFEKAPKKVKKLSTPEPSETPAPTQTPEPTQSPTPTPEPTQTPEPTPASTPTSQPLAIVSQGQAHAVIVKPAQSGSEINEAAAAVADYIARATGVTLSVYTVAQLDGLILDPSTITIRIGAGSYTGNQELEDEVAALHPDGFLIAPEGHELIITGPTPVGTRNGAYAFLEKYAGVTWLFPGEEWIDVPQSDELLMPSEAWKDEPTAFSLRRTMNMGSQTVYGTIRSEWQRQNRTLSASEITLGHNIFTIFPVEKYGDTAKYPNFYPNNKPPAPGVQTGWQPCYSNPATVTAAIEHIKAYFHNNPKAIAFSLAANDIGGYCEENPAHPDYPNKINSVGVQHMSEIYYKWVNEVVEGVLQDYPDKWFGLYAYQQVMDPPSFPLNPRVIPVITKDRLAWVDPEVEAQGKAHLEAWSEKAEQLGWYDYMLSYVYPLPRVYPHLVEQLYAYAQDQNVLVHHWDMHPVLGDGPQPWLIAKLGWSMEQDADTLLDHWYEAAVGPEAASYLKQYFELWEQFWKTEATDSSWFQTSKDATFLSWNSYSYLAYAREEVMQSRPLLESAVAKAQTPAQKTRAQQLLRQFEYYEASTLSYPRQIKTLNNDGEVLAMLNELEQTLEVRLNMAKRRPGLIEEFNRNPAQKYPVDPIARGASWSGWSPDEFWQLLRYLENNGPLDQNNAILQRIRSFQQNAANPKLREFAHLLNRIDIEQSLAEDASFEEENVPSWNKWNPAGSALIEVSEEYASTGERSLRFKNASQAGVWKYVNVNAGLLASSVKFYTPPGTTSKGVIQIVIELHTGKDKLVYYSEAMTLADHAGQWTELTFLEEMPAQINGRDIQNILINTQIKNASDAVVYVDDIGVYQVRYGTAELIELVNSYIEEGKLAGAQAQPMISLLQTAEEKYQQNESKQYVSLLADFIEEAKRLRSNNVLSGGDYQALADEAFALIRKQIDFQYASQEFRTTHAGTYKVPVTIKNNSSETFTFELSGNITDGIQLNFDNPVTVPANQSSTVEGTLTVPEALEEGDYLMDIGLELSGKTVLQTKLKVAHYTNLLKNPGFEEADPANPLLAKDWVRIGSVAERSNEKKQNGSYAFKMMPDPNSYKEARSDHVTVIPGAKYRLSGWVYSENSQAQFGLRQTNQATGGTSLKYDFTAASNSIAEWQYFELELVPRADAKILQVYLRILKNAGAPVWFDNMKLEIIEMP